MTVWTWALTGCQTRAYGGRELPTATGRSVTWRVDGPATAQFSLDGRSEVAAEIVALATDLLVYRDGVLLFRGRIGPEADDISSSAHRCQFTAVDYRSMLDTRRAPAAGLAYTSTQQKSIALNLITYTQGLTGGDWGITDGVHSSPLQTRDKTLDPGKPLGEAINEVARLANGFEWEIGPDLKFNTWATRGTNNGAVLDYGGLITAVNRQLPMEYANQTIVTGSDTTIPVTSTTAGIGTDPRGLWQFAAGYPSIIDQSTLDARGPWVLAESNVIRPTVAVTMTAGRWEGKAHIWIGDPVTLAVKSGRLNTATPHRAVEINASLDGDGGETIKMGLLAQ